MIIDYNQKKDAIDISYVSETGQILVEEIILDDEGYFEYVECSDEDPNKISNLKSFHGSSIKKEAAKYFKHHNVNEFFNTVLPTKYPKQFEKSTNLKEFPDYLKKDISGNILKVYSNGVFVYNIKGVYAKVSVIWNFEAPQGTGDTHYSIMRGSRSNIIIRQGAEENFKPTLYVEALKGMNLDFELEKAIDEDVQRIYPGISMEKLKDGFWRINIPDKYKVGHEEHFGQVTEKYLKYLVDGKLPDWEVPNMIAKYYTTTEALRKAKE